VPDPCQIGQLILAFIGEWRGSVYVAAGRKLAR
jgi:hypothetical protein